ncbi:DUF1737 domain-containing protein [Saccharopolyspora shandongensis]|uniref:DUF1737 domain-containing protein n=1 Tax=Saccharopolyspora shandongensis TaxID=418495 RepID=UPI00115FE548|nr:DUF1737 domain-containing protein [Saccharopolyspora shandongensis]
MDAERRFRAKSTFAVGEGRRFRAKSPPVSGPIAFGTNWAEPFRRRVSEAIALGCRLHEGPAVTFNGDRVIVAQALLWPSAADAPAS